MVGPGNEGLSRSFGGKITPEGIKAVQAIQANFGNEQIVRFPSMVDFLKKELNVENAGTQIIFGGVDEIMTSIGFQQLKEDWTDERGKHHHGWNGWEKKPEEVK